MTHRQLAQWLVSQPITPETERLRRRLGIMDRAIRFDPPPELELGHALYAELSDAAARGDV